MAATGLFPAWSACGESLADGNGLDLMTGREPRDQGRKTMNNELIHEQQRLKSILDGTRVGTWEWNVQTANGLKSILGPDRRLRVEGTRADIHRHLGQAGASR